MVLSCALLKRVKPIMSDDDSQISWRSRNDPPYTPDFFLKIGWDGQRLFFCSYAHEDQGGYASMDGQPLPNLTHWLRGDVPRKAVANVPLVENGAPILFWDTQGAPYLGYFKNDTAKHWFETLDGFQIDHVGSWAILPKPPGYSPPVEVKRKSFITRRFILRLI